VRPQPYPIFALAFEPAGGLRDITSPLSHNTHNFGCSESRTHQFEERRGTLRASATSRREQRCATGMGR
jgi:hypothetical protein